MVRTDTGLVPWLRTKTSRWLLGVFALALLVRLYGVNAPFPENATREFIGAIVARGYYFERTPGRPEWQREIARRNLENEAPYEPRIVPAMAAAVYFVTGEQPAVGRCLSIASWLAGAGFLFLLVRRWFDGRTALAAITYFLLTPFAILGSKLFQPDPLMLLLTLASLHGMCCYQVEPSCRRFLSTSLLAAMAMLVKPMCVFPLFAAALALCTDESARKRAAFKSLAAFGVIVLLPSGLFYGRDVAAGGAVGDFTHHLLHRRLLVDPVFWQGWAQQSLGACGLLPLVVAGAGLAIMPRGRGRRVTAALLLGHVAYSFTFTYHISTHDYYSLPLIAWVAIPAGYAVARWIEAERRNRGVWKPFLCAGAGILVAGLFSALWVLPELDWKKVTPGARTALRMLATMAGVNERTAVFLAGARTPLAKAALNHEIGELVHHTSRAILMAPGYGGGLKYYGGVAGFVWPASFDLRMQQLFGEQSPDRMALLPSLIASHKAEYFIVTDLKEWERQGDIQALLPQVSHLMSSNEQYIIFRLTP